MTWHHTLDDYYRELFKCIYMIYALPLGWAPEVQHLIAFFSLSIWQKCLFLIWFFFFFLQNGCVKVLNQIVYELPAEHPLADTRPLRELLGHTPPQVWLISFQLLYMKLIYLIFIIIKALFQQCWPSYMNYFCLFWSILGQILG